MAFHKAVIENPREADWETALRKAIYVASVPSNSGVKPEINIGNRSKNSRLGDFHGNSIPMTNPIHGHEVMQMMVESPEPFTRDSLKAAIDTRFGSDARFFTCSAENLTAEGLIDFLAERGKFIDREGGFSTAPGKMCNH